MASSPPNLLPNDVNNQRLVAQVHPFDWVNPTPQDRYDLVVIGAGTAGLVVAAGAAGLGLGLKIALIEKHFMGGDCLNVGCVPSKCLIRSARVLGELKLAESLGITLPQPPVVDFAAVMARMRGIRAGISVHDSVHRFQSLGVDVFLGQGKFMDDHSLEVDGQALRFKKAVIATGAKPSQPAIAGLNTTPYLTNETIFSLTERPDRLAIIGGGPIGCEFAQTFRRLGAEVIVFQQGSHLLGKEDPGAAEILHQVFQNEGIRVILGSQIDQITETDRGKILHFHSPTGNDTVTVDAILVGTGRTPNVEGLALEQVGVAYHPRTGIQVNDYLQTTRPHIYAAGDVCMNWKFTHAADAAARIVIKNALFSPFGIGRSRLSHLVMPWVTYTDPEIAHVGLSAAEAVSGGIAIETINIPLSQVDRAIVDGEEIGFVTIHHRQGSDKIVGATIVARHAGEMISEISTAIVHNLGLSALARVIHPYPTQAEGLKKAADAYRRTLLTPRSKTLLGLLTRLS